jgi:hypothetical protein
MSKLLDPKASLPPIILLAVGIYVLVEAASMSAFGAIFPRLAGLGIILGSLALLVRIALNRPESRPEPDHAKRALLLLATLLIWALMLPVIGFIPACLLGAAATMFLAEPNYPGHRVLAIRAAGLCATIILIALLFSRGLNVPLP